MIKSVRQNKITKKWEFDFKDLKGKRRIKKGYKTKAEAEKAQSTCPLPTRPWHRHR